MRLRYADRMEVFSKDDQQVFSTAAAQWGDIYVAQHMNGQKLNIELRAQETPVRFIRLRWLFAEDEKRSGIRIYGDEWERGYGAMEWRGIRPERCMPWVCAVSNGSDRNLQTAGRFTECYGVMTQPAAFCLWQYDTEGLTLWLDVRNGGEGVRLNGRTVDVCAVVMSEYRDESAFAALKAFYRELCPNPLKADHKVYGSNNWYYAYGHSSHEEILADTDFVAGLCAGLQNPPYMVIDDGWQPNPCDGPWHIGNERFLDMKGLCKSMKAKGVRTGIWIRYLRDRARQTEGITPPTHGRTFSAPSAGPLSAGDGPSLCAQRRYSFRSLWRHAEAYFIILSAQRPRVKGGKRIDRRKKSGSAFGAPVIYHRLRPR